MPVRKTGVSEVGLVYVLAVSVSENPLFMLDQHFFVDIAAVFADVHADAEMMLTAELHHAGDQLRIHEDFPDLFFAYGYFLAVAVDDCIRLKLFFLCFAEFTVHIATGCDSYHMTFFFQCFQILKHFFGNVKSLVIQKCHI